ncbi:MAG TPA: zinc-binding alcohol dehydrogenase family protein [Acidobacteriaceae bacterium]|nr:zinc-binding alcohol dehydrogenase family protein [Acidobacteriaceae bacterium]
MKAVVLAEPGRAQIAQAAKPLAGPGEALLQVRRVGLCGSDLNSFRGRNSMVSYPRIPGHEVAATIVEMSEAQPTLAVGMNVTLSPYTSCGKCASCRRGRHNACESNQTLGVQRDGALTEFICIPLDRLFPAKLSLEELCLVEPLTVGFHAAARGRVAAGETAVVIGCGGVGLGAIAAAAFRGATTVAVDVDDAKLAVARRAGAAHTIQSGRENLRQALRELTGGRGPDAMIEAVGTPATFRAAVEEVAYTGRVVYIGYAKEPVCYETRLFVQKELEILGSRNAQPEDFRQVIAMLEAGRFPVRETISTTVGLAQAPEIFAAWSAEPSRFTKIMIRVS